MSLMRARCVWACGLGPHPVPHALDVAEAAKPQKTTKAGWYSLWRCKCYGGGGVNVIAAPSEVDCCCRTRSQHTVPLMLALAEFAADFVEGLVLLCIRSVQIVLS